MAVNQEKTMSKAANALQRSAEISRPAHDGSGNEARTGNGRQRDDGFQGTLVEGESSPDVYPVLASTNGRNHGPARTPSPVCKPGRSGSLRSLNSKSRKWRCASIGFQVVDGHFRRGHNGLG